MSDHATLPLEAHDNRSAFLGHAWDIGRACRNQAMDLISICQLLSRLASPKLAHEEAELRRMHRVCHLALRSAADSGTKVTQEANARFKEATQMFSDHSDSRQYLDLLLTVYSKMDLEQWKDSAQRAWSHVKFEEELGPTMLVNFGLLRSPILGFDDNLIRALEELGASPSLPEILWIFGRYKDRARITLEQNPHFYLRFPADESAHTPKFRRHPLQDTSGALELNDTAYVLFDRSCVFLDIEDKPRIFGNVWSLNSLFVFRDSSGVLEGEQLVKSSSIREISWCCEQPVADHGSFSHSQTDHSWLWPIVTTPPANPPSEESFKFEDWRIPSHPESRSINIHIYHTAGSPGSTSRLDLPPPPPTSERPGYAVLYTTINTLDDDILLGIFNYYRLDDENSWNVRLGWCKLSHVCRRWRHLVYSSAFHLGMHILCTNGTPIVDTLDHIPPLPLFVDYRYAAATLSLQDELGIYHALRLRDRVRHIDLHLPPSTLHKFLMLMDDSFPILEQLSLSFTFDETTALVLPKTFWAPNLRHLKLLGICLPNGLPFLSTVSLVTLALTNIRASGYFLPRQFVAFLRSLPQLEELSIGFAIAIPRPSAERELLGKLETPVTLPNLKHLIFRGVSAYLEGFVAQIRAPHLERLNITLFGQIAFAMPHLSHFTSMIQGLKLPTAKVFFWRDQVFIIMGHHSTRRYGHEGRFILRVMNRQLDCQIDSAAQICSALIPVLSGVEKLTLDYYGLVMPTEWQDGEIDGTTWHGLLRSFIRVKELHICGALLQELSRALQMDDVGSDPGLLPELQELISEFKGKHAENVFGSFIHARQNGGRPVRLVRQQFPEFTTTQVVAQT